jgi:catechol 2,3-dioxygenase-like lactoylglutathione lyase family enzyme
MIRKLTQLARVLLAVGTFAAIATTQAQVYPQPRNQPAATSVTQSAQPAVTAVESVGMTVADMDRSIDFYSQVLSFQKVSDVEVLGTQYEQLQGLFGVRMRVVRMQLGSEFIELTEYLTPKGRSFPVDSRSNDRTFQHIALAKLAEGIAVRDMEQAYQHLRKFKVQHAGNRSGGAIINRQQGWSRMTLPSSATSIN